MPRYWLLRWGNLFPCKYRSNNTLKTPTYNNKLQVNTTWREQECKECLCKSPRNSECTTVMCDKDLTCDNQRQILAKLDGSCCPRCSMYTNYLIWVLINNVIQIQLKYVLALLSGAMAKTTVQEELTSCQKLVRKRRYYQLLRVQTKSTLRRHAWKISAVPACARISRAPNNAESMYWFFLWTQLVTSFWNRSDWCCECNHGFFYNGTACVAPTECMCIDETGNTRLNGDIWADAKYPDCVQHMCVKNQIQTKNTAKDCPEIKCGEGEVPLKTGGKCCPECVPLEPCFVSEKCECIEDCDRPTKCFDTPACCNDYLCPASYNREDKACIRPANCPGMPDCWILERCR